jgi:hypothetical protein
MDSFYASLGAVEYNNISYASSRGNPEPTKSSQRLCIPSSSTKSELQIDLGWIYYYFLTSKSTSYLKLVLYCSTVPSTIFGSTVWNKFNERNFDYPKNHYLQSIKGIICVSTCSYTLKVNETFISIFFGHHRFLSN